MNTQKKKKRLYEPLKNPIEIVKTKTDALECRRLPQPIRRLSNIKQFTLIEILQPIILDKPTIHPNILALHLQRRLRRLRLQHIMIIAMRTILVCLLELPRVLPERLFTLLANQCYLRGL